LEFEEKWGSQMSSNDLNAFPKGLQISPEISPSLVYSLYAKNYQNRLMYVEATACHSVSLWVTQHSHHHHDQFNTYECRMNNKEQNTHNKTHEMIQKGIIVTNLEK